MSPNHGTVRLGESRWGGAAAAVPPPHEELLLRLLVGLLVRLLRCGLLRA